MFDYPLSRRTTAHHYVLLQAFVMSSPAAFVHLRVHSEYSLYDSTVRVKKLIGATVAADMPAVALTDQSNMYALVKFYKGCLGQGIKPILGADLWLENPED
ncbi:PHP domain-containing protein, partial [Wenyingzhuangia sp. 1_MG-2023]|nr:PHP domain-containing protein [Wenyingzhuangia sp. 1_MG-2023]